MKTGNTPSTTWNRNVGAENKTVRYVDVCQVNTQSESKSRGGRMDLRNGNALPQDQTKYN